MGMDFGGIMLDLSGLGKGVYLSGVEIQSVLLISNRRHHRSLIVEFLPVLSQKWLSVPLPEKMSGRDCSLIGQGVFISLVQQRQNIRNPRSFAFAQHPTRRDKTEQDETSLWTDL